MAEIEEVGGEDADDVETGAEQVAETWSGSEHPIGIHQDASVYVSALDPANEVEHEVGPGRGVYLYVISGRISLAGVEGAADDELSTGDAAKITDEPGLKIRAEDESELILVDVPMQFEAVGVWAGRT